MAKKENNPEVFIKNKKVLLMGLGILGGGVATSRWLVKHGAKLTITDLKKRKDLQSSLLKLKPYLSKIKLVLGRHREKDFKENDIIIANPGVIVHKNHFLKIAKKEKKPIENDLSLFFKFANSPIIAVTGTRGKTTVASWLSQLLSQKYQAFLGGNTPENPVLSFLDSLKPENPVVLELSSLQLELLNNAKPKIAIITNLYIDHLNRYGTMEKYAQIKSNIFKNQDASDYLVLNYQNQWTKFFLSLKPKGKIYFVSSTALPLTKNGVYLKDNKVYLQENKKQVFLFPLGNFPEKWGRHNVENLMFVVLAAKIFGLSLQEIRKVFNLLTPVKFRQEVVAETKNLTIINDSAATSPEATIAALERFKNKNLYLISGGTDKKLSFNGLAKAIKKNISNGHLILLDGSATKKLIKELKKEKYLQEYFLYDSLGECFNQVLFLAKEKQSKSIVLFSPASASFEKFKNEFDRGEKFNQLVKQSVK